MVQVSMNPTTFEKAPIPVLLDLVKSMADSCGVGIADAELVGSVPLAALEEVELHCLRVGNFKMEQIVGTHLLA